MSSPNDALRQRAAELFTNEEYGAMMSLLDIHVLEKAQDAELYAWRARSHTKLKENETGFAYANKAVELDPENAHAYLARGNAWFNKGQFHKAIEDYSRSVEISPGQSGAFCNRGNSWLRLGNWDKAISDFDHAVELDPSNLLAYRLRSLAWSESGIG